MKISARLALLFVLGCSLTFVACGNDAGVGEGEFENGYYIDDFVSGVTYRTKGKDEGTREGKTGEDNDPGLFKYFKGEMVAFSLGDTDLGETIGKGRLTPFDLAGVTEAPVGGCEVDGELPDGDFQKVINLAVLLQTLDDDGDPSNNINITSQIASLFDNVILDLDKPSDDFQNDTKLQELLDEANIQSLFPDTRTLRDHVTALKALYKGLELCQ